MNVKAVPTKDHKVITLPLADVERYVGQFLEFALAHPELLFVVTRIGCGLAGFTDADIAPLFASAPSNCRLPEGWRDPIVEQVLANLSGDYTDAPDVDDHIMTIDEFKAACSSGGFIDYDGHGAPMLGGLVNPNVTIYPSTVDDDIPDGATHIVWYNR